jgi:hypothetical protein
VVEVVEVVEDRPGVGPRAALRSRLAT